MLSTRAVVERLPTTSGRLALAGAAVIVAITAVALSCTVDTELGLTAQVTSADIHANGSGASAVITVDVTTDVRVGEHAQGMRTFIVPRLDLLVGDTLVATVNLDRPVGFDGTLAPGESQTIRLHGATFAGSFDPAAICVSPTPTVRIVLHWNDMTAMEMGTAEGTTTRVTCTP